MQSKSSTSTVLVILLIVCTFPIWVGIAAGIFGLMAGLIGAVFGILAGVFGAVFGIVGSIFGGIFHWGGGFHWNFLTILLIVGIIVLISRPRKH